MSADGAKRGATVKHTDRIAVLRDGCNAGDFATESASRQEVLAEMLGTAVDELYPPREGAGEGADEVALQVTGLSLADALDDISFEIHRGEVLGVFGLLGSGIDQVGRAIYGALGAMPGARIVIGGKNYNRGRGRSRRR